MSNYWAIHTYEPDKEGRCTSGWYNSRGEWIKCGSSQRSSVLHDDEEAEFRERHWHGGGDCMCFEDQWAMSSPKPSYTK